MSPPRGARRVGVMFALTLALMAALVSSSPVQPELAPRVGMPAPAEPQHLPGRAPEKKTTKTTKKTTKTTTKKTTSKKTSTTASSTLFTTTVTEYASCGMSSTSSVDAVSASASSPSASASYIPSGSSASYTPSATVSGVSASGYSSESGVSSTGSVTASSAASYSGSSASSGLSLASSAASYSSVSSILKTLPVSSVSESVYSSSAPSTTSTSRPGSFSNSSSSIPPATSTFASSVTVTISNHSTTASYGNKTTTYLPTSTANATLSSTVSSSATVTSSQVSCNTAEDRQCWTSGYDIDTDYETDTPFTGETKTFTLVLTEVDDWVSGDGGIKTKAMLVNGSSPGPTIEANWGDRINVTVINNLLTNGTSLHWHGVRQLNTNNEDGTNGITECPLPPNGGSRTYSFLATQYGTSWYHSHFSVQYANGVLGPIVIHGPASANYDIDLGPLLVSDWYYGAADQILERANSLDNPYVAGVPGSSPTSDNVLFNGLNVNVNGTAGQYEQLTLTPGKKHLLRLVNPSVENTFTLSMVDHSFTVIATDFVPIEPVNVSSLYIAVGQRYDVIIEANQATDSYWFNATLGGRTCGTSYNPYPAAILSYEGAASTTPTSTGTAPPSSYCADSLTLFTPVVPRSADVSAFSPDTDDTLTTNLAYSYDGVARVFWPVNGVPINVSWSDPTLAYVRDGTTAQMDATENVIAVPDANVTTFWLLENNSTIPHPIHLHGHDVLVLGASTALEDPTTTTSITSYDPSTDAASLNGNNPTRRDSTMLPAWGWLVLAFTTDNPGSWLFHCHLAWHVSQGFAVQFLEQLDAIPQAVDLSQIEGQCQQWDAYYPANDPFTQEDSGL